MKRMSRITWIAAVAALGLAAGCSDPGSSAAADAPTKTGTAPAEKASLPVEDELLALVNAHRVALGLNALISKDAITLAARAHSEQMSSDRFFSHRSPDGRTPGERLADAGVEWDRAGENIAAGYDTPEAVFNAWMESPTHRDAIEAIGWTHSGIGYAYDNNPTDAHPHAHYWTQDFVKQPAR